MSDITPEEAKSVRAMADLFEHYTPRAMEEAYLKAYKNMTFLSAEENQRLSKSAKIYFDFKAEVRSRSKKSELIYPPGYRAWHLLSFIYSRSTLDRVFKPHIADMRADHAAALAEGAYGKARWINIRDNTTIAWMVVAHIPTWVVRLALKCWPSITL